LIVRGFLAACLAAAVAPAARAQTTLTFGADACAGSSVSVPGTTVYTESGFQLSFEGAGLAFWCASSPNYPGSAAAFQNNPGELVTLTKIGGGVFALNSIDLASLFSFGPGTAGSTSFVGDVFGGGQVNGTGGWNFPVGNPTFSTDAFNATWTNLVDVQFTQNLANYFQFDNIVVNAGTQSVTPEPATMTLMATGLVGLVGAGLRRRKRA
jgi:PEP-CTERM motif